MDDVVITTWLTKAVDPQRGEHLPCDPGVFDGLYRSVAEHGHRLVVLHDGLDDAGDADGISFVRVFTDGFNPYFERWWVICEHLATVDYDRVWCVDATDVEMLHDPFPRMQPGVVYAGSEPATPLARTWLAQNHEYTMLAVHPLEQNIFNAGLLGGDVADIATVAGVIVLLTNDVDLTDMAAFNLALRGRTEQRLPVLAGLPVHTQFRANDRTNPTAWWRHK